VKGVEEVARNVPDNGVDSRFVAPRSKNSQQHLSATAAPSPSKLSTLSTLGQAQGASRQIASAPGQPIRVIAGAEQIAPPDLRAIAQINQRNMENARQEMMPAAQKPPVSAAIIPASATQIDLSRFVGRYEVDPAKVENFV